MKSIRLIAFILWLSFLCRPALGMRSPEEQHRYFLVSKDSRICGYSVLSVSHLENKVIESRAETFMKFSMLAEDKQDTKYIAVSRYVDSNGTAALLDYRVSIFTGSNIKTIECKVKDGNTAVLKGLAAEVKRSKTLSVPQDYCVLDNNIYGHFYLLFKYMNYDPGKIEIPVLVPQVGSIRNIRGGTKTSVMAEIAGSKKNLTLLYLRLEPQIIKVWLDQSKELKRLELPLQNVAIEETTRGMVNGFKKIAYSPDPSKLYKLSSNITCPYLAEKSRIEVDFTYSNISSPRLEDFFLPYQEFSGEIGNGVLKGEFILDSRKITQNPNRFPDYSGRIPPELRVFLAATQKISANSADIISVYKDEIGGPSGSPSQDLENIAGWVSRNIDFEEEEYDSLGILKRKSGNSLSICYLTAALLRAARIPARVVSGWTYFPYDRGVYSYHNWVEAYVGNDLWCPVDPLMGEITAVDPFHIKIKSGTAFKPRNIRINEFSPDRTFRLVKKKTAYHPFNLKVGTDRYFSFKVAEELFGYIHARVEDSLKLPGGEMGYQWISHLVLNTLAIGYNIYEKIDASQIVTTNGSPLLYRSIYAYVGNKIISRRAFQAKVQKNEIEVTNYVGDKEVKSTISLPANHRKLINGKGLIDEWTLLFKSLVPDIPPYFIVNLFVPELKKLLEVDIFYLGKANIKLPSGKQTECHRLEVPLLGYFFWIDGDGEIIRAEIPGEKVNIERTDEKVLEFKVPAHIRKLFDEK